MPLGREVGLSQCDIVLDWDQASHPPKRGTAAVSIFFGPCLFWPNGWMDQAWCIVAIGQTSGWIKMPLGMDVALALATLC